MLQRTKTSGDAPHTSVHPASYWAATANPTVELPSLSTDTTADVAIVGGGFTGLAAAYHLAERGLAPVVLEAQDAGWGASGRNGGMLPPRYKKGFAAVAKTYGNEVTRKLYGLIHEALDTVERISTTEAIACDFSRCGQLTVAHSQGAMDSLEADAAWAGAEMNDRTVRILNGAEVRDEVGGGRHVGGWLDPRGAGIHPLNYARGLAGALVRRGVAVHAGSPVLNIREESDGVRLETPAGSVKAKQIILATNAYTDVSGFAPDNLERRVVPVTSSVIATEPLGDLVRSIIPQRRMVADTRRIMNYYRVMPDTRLVFGGRGDLTGRRDDPEVYRTIEGQMRETFPQLASTAIQWRWAGKVAVTTDDLPHLGRLSPRIIYAMGYGGRGVALSNLFGKYAAALAAGEAADLGPMSSNPFKSIPFHAFRMPGMQMVAAWWRHLDDKETKASVQGIGVER